jgi:hypothetical protein
MRPDILVLDDWQQLTAIIVGFWLLVALVVPAAFAFLFAHAVIPSLVYTGPVRARANRFRAPLYLVAALFGLASLAQLVRVVLMLQPVVEDIYPRWLV